MGAGSLGDLLITMSADTAKWQSDMGKMVRDSQKATMDMTKAFEGVTSAIGKASGLIVALAAGAGLKELVQSSVEWNTEVVKLSKSLGDSTEEASAFKSMLEHLGIDQDTLTNSMLKLEKAAASSPEKFDKLGISIRDANGNLLPAQQILFNFNARMNEFTEGAPRNAAASMVMGKGTKDLGSLLKATNEELEKGAERVKALGLVVTAEGATKTREYKQSMNDLAEALGAVKKAIGSELIGELTHLAKAMSEGVESGFPEFVKGLHSCEAELIRMAMLADKAGGTMTSLGMMLYGPGAALGNANSKKQFDKMAQWNIDFETNYEESSKKLQALAYLEVGLDANGQPIKAKAPKVAKEGFNPGAMTDKASDWTAAHNKYIEYEKAFEERRAAQVKIGNDFDLQLNQQAYARGLTDLDTYLNKKNELTLSSLSAEVAAKNKELLNAQTALTNLQPVTDAKGKGNPSKDAENRYAALLKEELAQKALAEAIGKLKLEKEKLNESDRETFYTVLRGYQEQQAALADFQGDLVGAAAIRKKLDEESHARKQLEIQAAFGDMEAQKALTAQRVSDFEKVRQAAVAQKKVLDDIRLSTPDKYGNVNAFGQRQQSLNLAVGDINAKESSIKGPTQQLALLEDQKTAIIAKSKAEQLAIQQKYDADMLQSQLSAADKAMSLMVTAAGNNKGVQLAALAVQTGIAVAQIEIAASVARMRAMAELGPIAGSAMAGEITAMEMVNIGLTIGAGAIQAIQIAGKKAAGGPVTGGETYLVGEKGPEIFTPGVSGGITPNNALGGGGLTQHVTIDARGADQGVDQKIRAGMRQAVETAYNKVLNGMNRGGEMALASGRVNR